VAINGIDGRYGAIETPLGFYGKYNEEPSDALRKLIDNEVSPQDVLLYNLFEKERLLDIVKYFVVFELDEGRVIKKLPRYQQLRAVNKIVHRLKTQNRGGVVWHTQGSGKSITMIYLATKLRATSTGFDNPTILVVTDRTELDEQISKTFRRTGFANPLRATSIAHLKSLLRDDYGKTLTTTIQKFQERAEKSKEVEVLSEKENIFVLIDEAHRSQYGLTASYMRQSLPHAKFIAFTGTPIDKESRSTLHEFDGGEYIDKYTIKESVADGNTLPIFYETGLSRFFIEKEMMDEVFEKVFAGVSEEKQGYLRKRGTSLDVVLSATRRVEECAKNIVEHYASKSYLDGFKAMIVCHNRYQAIAYKKALDGLAEQGLHGFKSKVIMSFEPKKDPKEFADLAVATENQKSAREDFKLPFGDENEKRLDGKKRFDNTAFLIVSDMLLTGYDAPILQTLYIDKVLKEHNLLQAIARVNRTRKGKTAGFVVDYVGITKHLIEALEIFSGDLEVCDVMVDIESEKSVLENRHAKLVGFFKSIKKKPYSDRYGFLLLAVNYLKPQDIKDKFRALLKDFNASMNIVLPDAFASQYDYDFRLYNELKLMSRDEKERITKEESQKLQRIVDEHLRANGVEYLLAEPIDITDYKQFSEEMSKEGQHNPLEKAKAIIKANQEKNPLLALELSELLERVLLDKKIERKEAVNLFLGEMEALINRHKSRHIVLGLSDERQLGVYDLVQNSELTLEIFDVLDDWLHKKAILVQSDAQKEMRNVIKPLLGSYGLERKLSKEIVKMLVKTYA
jgi:type I restriction enzyme R subunit